MSKHPNHTCRRTEGDAVYSGSQVRGDTERGVYGENVPEVWVLETTPFMWTFMGAMDYYAGYYHHRGRRKVVKIPVMSVVVIVIVVV